jgi:PhnB protein
MSPDASCLVVVHNLTTKGSNQVSYDNPIPTLITATLSVRNGREAIPFYEKAFAAQVMHRVDNDSGEVVAQLSVDGAEFWIADESPEHQNFSPASLGGCSVRMMLVVSDPDEVLQKAVVAGATEIVPVGEAHGWRLGRIQDPFGHHWEIGSPLPH